MKEQVCIADLCRKIGFTIDAIKQLLKSITLSIASSKLYSSEHKQYFEVKDAKVKIDHEPDNPDKLRLNFNEMDILEWFRQKYQELQQRIKFNSPHNFTKNKGVRL
jgi:hypothetical protein